MEDAPSGAEFAAAFSGNSLADLEIAGYGVARSLRGTWLTIVDEGTGNSEPSTRETYREELGESDLRSFDESLAICRLEARDKFPRIWSIPEVVASEIGELRGAVLRSDPELLDAEQLWRGCMASNGLAVTNRDDLIAELQQAAVPVEEYLFGFLNAPRSPSTTEKEEFEELVSGVELAESRLAETDLQCSGEARLDEIRRRVLERAENEWLEQNRERVALALAEQSGQ